jgi:cyanophycinase
MNQSDNFFPKPKGTLLIIGGAEDKGDDPKKEQEHFTENTSRMEVLKCFIKLLETKDAVIELITSASSDKPDESYEKYKTIFEKLGVKTVNHIHHDSREQVDTDDLAERLKAAEGVFFSGGDQLKLTSVYGGTNFLLLLKQRYIHDQIVIAGTSAGAMAMSTPMIYQGVGRDEMIAGNVKVTTGLEFLRDACIDTHFVNRGRVVRM